MDNKSNDFSELSLFSRAGINDDTMSSVSSGFAPNSEAQHKVICADLAYSRNISDLTQRIKKIVTDLGFSDFLFMRLERVWQTESSSGLLYSLPKELMRIYHEEHMHKTDLMIPYGKANTQPIFSSQIYGYINSAPFEMELTNNNRLLLQLYKRFGYFEHCAIPAQAFNGNGHVLLILTSTGVKKHDFQSMATPKMPACRSLCKAIDTVTSKKFKSQFIDKADHPISLPRKPLDALRRLARSDKPITEIAYEMCISPITAHQHIATARKALRAKTNIGAIIKAVKAGLINID